MSTQPLTFSTDTGIFPHISMGTIMVSSGGELIEKFTILIVKFNSEIAAYSNFVATVEQKYPTNYINVDYGNNSYKNTLLLLYCYIFTDCIHYFRYGNFKACDIL
jgi:hypothetical protein